jgi:hypothetical protein
MKGSASLQWKSPGASGASIAPHPPAGTFSPS